MTISYNKKKKMIYALLILGVVITLFSLVLGIKHFETKLFNLIVGLTAGLIALFGFVGKYIHEVNSGENMRRLQEAAVKTYDKTAEANSKLDLLKSENANLKSIVEQQNIKLDYESKIRENEYLLKLKSSIRRYRETKMKFSMLEMSMSKMFFVSYSKDNIRQLRYEVNLIVNEILQSSFVSENVAFYTEWQLVRNEVLTFLNFYSLPNGIITNENDKSFEITDKAKEEKFSNLKKYLSDSEIKLEVLEQKILDTNGIKEL